MLSDSLLDTSSNSATHSLAEDKVDTHINRGGVGGGGVKYDFSVSLCPFLNRDTDKKLDTELDNLRG